MECPLCTHENLDGMDNCTSCGTDLTYLGKLPAENDIERELLTHPLHKLACEDYVVVEPGTTVGETLKQWREAGVHCAMVVEDDELVGIFTERDVLNKIAAEVGQRTADPVSLYMTGNPETLEESVPVAYALNRMMVGGYRRVPLTRDGKLVGAVSVRDVFEYLVGRFPQVLGAA